MSRIIKGKTWKKVPSETANKIRKILEKHSEVSPHPIKSPYEKWRYKFLDVFITFYSTGTLYVTPSRFPRTEKLLNYLDGLIASKFLPSKKTTYIGCDEAGKGEVIGSIVLACVKFSRKKYPKLIKIIGTADTKNKHSLEYWEELFDLLSEHISFQVEFIPPSVLIPKQTNKIMDKTYVLLLKKTDFIPNETRLVIDDYRAGKTLKNHLYSLEKQGAEIILTSKADDNFLEAKVASVIAKYFKEKFYEKIRLEAEKLLPGVPLGSGNAGDKKTIHWLQEYYKKYSSWPSFIKTYFKTVSEIEKK